MLIRWSVVCDLVSLMCCFYSIDIDLLCMNFIHVTSATQFFDTLALSFPFDLGEQPHMSCSNFFQNFFKFFFFKFFYFIFFLLILYTHDLTAIHRVSTMGTSLQNYFHDNYLKS